SSCRQPVSVEDVTHAAFYRAVLTVAAVAVVAEHCTRLTSQRFGLLLGRAQRIRTCYHRQDRAKARSSRTHEPSPSIQHQRSFAGFASRCKPMFVTNCSSPAIGNVG